MPSGTFVRKIAGKKRKRNVFSVIMPVYNSKAYLGNAIESVLKQTYRDFELLLIDDGSTDGSLDLCRSYERKDKRVKVFTKENGGLSSARNLGIEYAKGDYLAFIDNDDEYKAECLERVNMCFETYHCDLVRFNRIRIQEYEGKKARVDVSGTEGLTDQNKPAAVLSWEEILEDYIKIKKSGAMYGIWNGVYRKSLFDTVRFDTRIRFGGEDWLVNLQLYEQAERAVFISDALYIYRKRAVHSVSAKFDLNRAEAVVWVADYERKMLESMMGKNGWETLRCCQAIYLVHIIKILQNKSCQLPLKEKVAYVKSLKASEGFALLGETKCFQTPWLENACIWMYRNHMEFFLYLMISLILKVRGNL